MTWRTTNTVANPLAMNIAVAAAERGERRASPQMPWPDVQPALLAALGEVCPGSP